MVPRVWSLMRFVGSPGGPQAPEDVPFCGHPASGLLSIASLLPLVLDLPCLFRLGGASPLPASWRVLAFALCILDPSVSQLPAL